MKLTEQRQGGWTAAGALGVLIACACGAMGFWFLGHFVPAASDYTPPWFLITILLLPTGFAAQLLIKLGELKETDGISRDEKRRLDFIVDGKIRQVIIAIVFYMIAAAVIAAMLLAVKYELEFYLVAITVTGGLLGISIYSIALIAFEFKEISDYKGKIHDRESSRKRQQDTLKRLHPK